MTTLITAPSGRPAPRPLLNENQIAAAWESFFESKAKGEPDRDIQRSLVEYYYPNTVKKVANKMHQKLVEVQPDELASMGLDGLYQAVMGFEKDRGCKFETYAMHRIRGAMLDEIRKADWIPRLVRSKAAWLEKQRSVLQSAAGRRLSNDELFDRIAVVDLEKKGIKSKDEFETFVKSSETPAMHSVNDSGSDDEGEQRGLSLSQAADERVTQPLDGMVRRELFTKLLGMNFTPQERKIIWLYYFEDRSMKEISDKVDLSESRVSQMHGKILNRLKKKADRNPEYFADIWEMIAEFKGVAA